MKKEGEIEKKESPSDYLKAESMDVSDLTKQYEFVGSVEFIEANLDELIEIGELEDAFEEYYGNEIIFRLGREKAEEVLPVFEAHDNFFSQILSKIEGNVNKFGDPLDPKILEVYKNVEKDIKEYFQLGWDECEENLKAHLPEIWEKFQKKPLKNKRTKDLLLMVRQELGKQGKDPKEKRESMDKIMPETEKDERQIYKLRKDIAEKYIETVKEKRPELFKKYIGFFDNALDYSMQKK